MNSTKPSITIFVCNMSEDVWPFISSLDDDKAKQFEISENANMSDWNVFSLNPGEKGILLSPRSLNDEFLAYTKQFSGANDVTVLTPSEHSGQTSLDVMNDKKLFSELLRLGDKNSLSMTSYTTSPQFYTLVQNLKSHGITVVTPDAPLMEDSWTTEFFGTKTGFRQLYMESSRAHKELTMTTGRICVGIGPAATFGAQMYKNGGVVFKTHKGHSGFGVLIVHPGSLDGSKDSHVNQLYQKLSKESYWNKFPIVVEQFIEENTDIAGGFPNAEGYIDQQGIYQLLYLCGNRMTKAGVFKGIEIHEKIMSPNHTKNVIHVARQVGKEYSKHGYRGFFDIDFVAGQDGAIYALESATRRTGGTHLHVISQKIYGKKYMSKIYSLSNNNHALPPNSRFTFTSLKTLLSSLLFNWKTKEGIVLTSENMLRQNAFAYVIFAKTQKRALAIETEMEKLV